MNSDRSYFALPLGEVDTRAESSMVSFGAFRLDIARRLLSNDREPVRIGSRALDILIVLIDRAGDIVGRHELLDLVWQGLAVDEASVRVHIASLRRVLGDGKDGARYIVNVAGRGYSFVGPISRSESDTPSPTFQSPAPRIRSRVPLLPRLVIGRESVVGSLSELLVARRFVSIVGSGGIGKTTVAVAIIDKLRSAFGDENVGFVDLGAVSDRSLVTEAVISAVGCTLASTDPVAQLLAFLADKRMLIVFDSCEHMLDPTSLLAEDIFQRARDVHLLVTSRESLRVAGETVHLLSPLTFPTDEFPTAAEALATPAVQLFMDRATSSGFHGQLGDADAPIVSEICRRTDGIALAIELAASRVGTYGIAGVASLLASNAELRLVGRRNVAERHQTLEAMLDWSFKLLTQDEQKTLSRLSVFVGLFTMEAACAVADDEISNGVATVLANLVDKSLVWVHPSGEAVYYRLLDTTRAYAQAKLAQAGESELIAARHACHFAALFKTIAGEKGTHEDIGRHRLHIGNVRKALEWSFSRQEYRALGVDLTADASPLFIRLWLFAECRNWAITALGALENTKDILEQEVRLQEALALCSMHTRGNSQEVRDALERALDLSQADGSELPQLRLVAGLEIFLTRLGDVEGALAAAKRFSVIAARADSSRYTTIAEWMLAATQHQVGDQAAAADHYDRGFRLAADVADLDVDLFGYNHQLRAMIGRARVLWNRGAPQMACMFARQAMDEAARQHHPTNYCIGVVYSVPVLLWSGDNTDICYEPIERVLAYAERYSLAPYAGVALALKGEWLVMTGNPSAGVDNLRHALKVLDREKHQLVTSPTLRALAEGLARCGSYHEAKATIDAAIPSAWRMGQRLWLPELYRTQGEIILMGPRPDTGAAEQAFRRSIDLARGQGAMGWELKAAIRLARLLLQKGQAGDATALVEPIYEAHVQKFGTTDLADAAELLDRGAVATGSGRTLPDGYLADRPLPEPPASVRENVSCPSCGA